MIPRIKNDPQDQKMIPKEEPGRKTRRIYFIGERKRSTGKLIPPGPQHSGGGWTGVPVTAEIVIGTPKASALPGQEEWTEFEKWLQLRSRRS